MKYDCRKITELLRSRQKMAEYFRDPILPHKLSSLRLTKAQFETERIEEKKELDIFTRSRFARDWGYEYIEPFSKGYAWATTRDEKSIEEEKWLLCRDGGAFSPRTHFDECTPVGDGYCWIWNRQFKKAYRVNANTGVMDNGLSADIFQADGFEETGLIRLGNWREGTYRLYNTKGESVMVDSFQVLTSAADNVFWYSTIHDGRRYYVLRNTGMERLAGLKNEENDRDQRYTMKPFSEGYGWVSDQKSERSMLFNTKGEIVLDFKEDRYFRPQAVHGGVFVVNGTHDHKFILNLKGESITGEKGFLDAGDFTSHGIGWVQDTDRQGTSAWLINREGKRVKDLRYEYHHYIDMENFTDDSFFAQDSENNWHVIDIHGERTSTFPIRYASEKWADFAKVITASGEVAYINKWGQKVFG